MTLEEAFRAYVLGDPAIAALVGGRMYPLRLPQRTVVPAIVFQLISDVRQAHLRGPAGLARPRLQLDCWASTYDGATVLGALCRQRLDGFAGRWTDGASPPAVSIFAKVFYETATDVFEADILGGLCRHSADYFVFHSTGDAAL